MCRIVLVFAALFFVSCMPSASYQVVKRDDKFDGYSSRRLYGNRLNEGGLLGDLGATLCIDLQKFTSKSGEVFYHIIAMVGSDHWMFIPEGETLVVLVDGKRIGFSGDGSYKNRDVQASEYSHRIHEYALYKIKKSDILSMANATSIDVKVVGDKYVLERKFNPDNFSNFKRFIKEHMSE